MLRFVGVHVAELLIRLLLLLLLHHVGLAVVAGGLVGVVRVELLEHFDISGV